MDGACVRRDEQRRDMHNEGRTAIAAAAASKRCALSCASSDLSYASASVSAWPSRSAIVTSSTSHSEMLARAARSEAARSPSAAAAAGQCALANWNTSSSRPPANTTRPCSSMMSASKRAKAVAVGLWMVAQMVVPSASSFCTTAITSFAVNESRPEVGSARHAVSRPPASGCWAAGHVTHHPGRARGARTRAPGRCWCAWLGRR